MRRTLRNARWHWLPKLYGWQKDFPMSLGGHCGIRRSYPSFYDNVFQNSKPSLTIFSATCQPFSDLPEGQRGSNARTPFICCGRSGL